MDLSNEWFGQFVPEFNGLSPEERQEILTFSLLWGLFEARCLKGNASSSEILKLADRWKSQKKFDSSRFRLSLDYFRQRYLCQGATNDRFRGLNFRKNDKSEFVESVLMGSDVEPTHTAAALLIIGFRLRNNLFHGLKWAYGMRDQLDNFRHANLMMVFAIETTLE